jgi:hypothetical protein
MVVSISKEDSAFVFRVKENFVHNNLRTVSLLLFVASEGYLREICLKALSFTNTFERQFEHDVKTCGGLKVQLQPFLTSTPDGDEY